MILEIQHYIDENGDPIVSVPLPNTSKKVHLFQSDFITLVEMGLSPRWRLINGHIAEAGTRLNVTRLVADVSKGEIVQLKDNDPCNLKRSNLIISDGQGRYNARDRLSQRQRTYKKLRIQLKHTYSNPPHIQKFFNEDDSRRPQPNYS